MTIFRLSRPQYSALWLSWHRLRRVWGGEAKRILLSLADPQFDLLLTLDKNLSYQQNLDTKRTAVLIVRARSNRIQDLLPVIPECLAALERIQWQPVVRVDSFPPQ